MKKNLFSKSIFGYDVDKVETEIEKLNEQIRQLNVEITLAENVERELAEQVRQYQENESQLIEIPMQAQNSTKEMIVSANKNSIEMKDKYNIQCEEWLISNKEEYDYLNEMLKQILNRRDTMMTTLEKLLEHYIVDLDSIHLSLDKEYKLKELDLLKEEAKKDEEKNIINFPLQEDDQNDIPLLTIRKVK